MVDISVVVSVGGGEKAKGSSCWDGRWWEKSTALVVLLLSGAVVSVDGGPTRLMISSIRASVLSLYRGRPGSVRLLERVS